MISETITKNDLTAILNEVLPTEIPTPSLNEPIDITDILDSTDGWTCTDYGIVVARCVASGSAAGYYINDTTLNFGVCQVYDNTRANNTACTTSFPTIKGHTYKQTYFAGQSRAAHFYKFKTYDISPVPTSPSGFGTSIDIASYTAKATAFSAPSDGFIWLQCRYTSGNYIGATVCNADGTNERSIQIVGNGTGNCNATIPIFKGMKVWKSSDNGSNNYIDFVPYI